MVDNNRNPSARIILLLSGAFIFAYCFGIVIHEIGHVLAYRFYGVSTKTFVIHPFGRNYMEPEFDIERGQLLIYASGSLFNVICAVLFSILFRRVRSLFIVPFLMWGSTSLIQESIAMILDIANGGQFDWSMVVRAGFPLWLVIVLSISFLTLGSLYFLRLMAFAGLGRSDSYTRILGVSLVSVVPFFLIALIYAGLYQKTMIFAKTIPFVSSIGLAIILSVIFRPTFEFLERAMPNRKFGAIGGHHIVFSVGLALAVILTGLLFFN